MATLLPWGDSVTVLMELGFPVNPFTLDDPGLGVLDSNFLDGTLLGDDVAPYVKDISISRGRQDQLSLFSAGIAQITLLNNDRRFDPTNESSPYWNSTLLQSGVTPRRKVTIKMDNETLFVGRITDIGLSYATGKSTDISDVVIQAADDFVLLANTAITSAVTPTQELSGARLNYLLQLPEVSYGGTTNIDAGTATLGAYQIDANTNALAYAQAVAEAEQGFFFVARDGTLTFTDRVQASFAASAGLFTDDGGTGIKYQNLSILYGQEFLYNKVSVIREGGTPQVADDVASQTEYGISTLSLTDVLLADDVAAQALANQLITLYGKPAYRFEGMTLAVSALPDAQRTTVFGLELGDTIQVERNYQTGTPANVVKYQTIERLRHVITPGVHRLEVAMSEAYVVFQFVLDDPVFGLMDEDNALA